MPTNMTYECELLAPYFGAKFIGVLESSETDKFLGLILEKDGKKFVLWIEREPNGGWIDIDELS